MHDLNTICCGSNTEDIITEAFDIAVDVEDG